MGYIDNTRTRKKSPKPSPGPLSSKPIDKVVVVNKSTEK